MKVLVFRCGSRWQDLTARVYDRHLRSERGASLVEYAFLLALIAMVCIVAVAYFGTQTSSKLNMVANSLS